MFPFPTFMPSGYNTGAVTFDGSNDYQTRGAGLTGAADGTKLLISGWFKFAADEAGTTTILNARIGAANYFNLYRNAATVYLDISNTAGAQIVSLATSSTVTAASGWNHIAIALDMATPTAYLYVNGVDAKTQTTLTAGTLELTPDNWRFGNDLGGANTALNANVADFYMAFEYLALNANIGKFYSGGKPVNLGTTGATPTGTQPIVFFRHVTGAAASDFGTNQGSGGDFTITGTLTEATTSPSD